jgi:hypothetical protein
LSFPEQLYERRDRWFQLKQRCCSILTILRRVRRFSGESDTGDLLEVFDERDLLPGLEECCERFTLAMADLKGEKAVWFQCGVGLGDEAAVEVEAVGAGEESGCGLVVADLRVEGGAVGFGDVRRIADDGVEALAVFGVDFVVAQGREEVGRKEVDAVGHVVFAGVGGGDGEGFGGDVEGGDLSVGKVDGEGDRDGSGASADVYYLQRDVFWQTGEDGFDEVLGLGAWDQDGGSDVEEEAVELLLAGDVLDGLVLQAASDAGLITGLLLCGELACGVGEEGGAGNLQGVEKQELGVARGGCAEMLVVGELTGGGGDGLTEGHGGEVLLVSLRLVERDS